MDPKNFIKRFWPLPVNTFYREMESLKSDTQADLQGLLRELELSSSQREQVEQNRYSKLLELIEKQSQLLGTLGTQCASMLQKLEQIECSLEKNVQGLEHKVASLQDVSNEILRKARAHVYYNCMYEVRDVKKGGFYEAREAPDYLSRYRNLIRGLDDESINTINLILSRHLLIKDRSEEDIDLFSEREQEIILAQRERFYASMLEVVPNVFACGKYLLASPQGGMGYLESTIFLDEMGFHKLRHPQRIRKKDILDLGAFIGDSALVLQKFTDKTVYAFEPGKGNFEALQKTLALNGCDNVVPICAAVGEGSEEAWMPTWLSMGLTINTQPQDSQAKGMERSPVISVDDFVAKHNLDVGLIKVDVEGFEQAFLKGARQTITQQKPALLISMYHSADDFFGLKPILESWNLGYHFQVHKEINEHVHYDTMLIAEIE